MSRYLLFAGYGRKAAGGYDDYVGSRPSVDAMKLLFDKTNIGSKRVKPAWGDIVDVTNMCRICSFREHEWFDNTDLPSHIYDK